MEKACKHKFVFKSNDSYYHSASRYSWKYVSVDNYFCEKCLINHEDKKQITINDGDLVNLPDWAKTITKKVRGYE